MDEYTHAPAEDQDELDAVHIVDNGEPLVDFLKFCPAIQFTAVHPVFEFPRVHVVRLSVAKMLADAISRLPAGYILQVVEGYRPIQVQRAMFCHALLEARKRLPEADEITILREAGRYSAPPDARTPPPHLTGGAVDLGLLGPDGEMLDMHSPFELTDMRQAGMFVKGLSDGAQNNRALLRQVLDPTGLTNYSDEWWHWSYGDNGWALRVGASHAIYDKVEVPANAHWVGDLSKMPA